MSVHFSQRVDFRIPSGSVPGSIGHSFSLSGGAIGGDQSRQSPIQRHSVPLELFTSQNNPLFSHIDALRTRFMERAGQQLQRLHQLRDAIVVLTREPGPAFDPLRLALPFGSADQFPRFRKGVGEPPSFEMIARRFPEPKPVDPAPTPAPASKPGGSGPVIIRKPHEEAPVDKPSTDKPSQGAPDIPGSGNPSKPPQDTAPPTPQPEPRPTPEPKPEPRPEPKPEPAPVSTPAPKPEPKPAPAPAPEPVSGPAPGGASSGIDKDELATVEAVEDILLRSNNGSSLGQSDIAELNKIYGDFRLSDKTTHRLNDYATTAAEAFLEDPAIIAHAQNWENYSASQRGEAARAVWEVYSDILGIPDTVGFDTVSLPRDANGFGTGGYYDTKSQSVVVNIHESAHRNFAEMTSILLHEATHALWARELAHIPSHKAADMFRDGEITQEQFMLQANIALYLDPRTVSFAKYAMNPHEQLAFTAEMLYRDVLRDGGTEVRERLPSGHPLREHLRDMNLISPNAAMT